MDYPIDVQAIAELVAIAEPTREQKCADLARAMFPTAVIKPSSIGNGVDIRVYDKPNETRSWYDFNPYKSDEDLRALVKWMAKQREADRFNDELVSIIGSTPLQALITPLPVIAEAAWRAIAAERPKAS